MKRFAFAFLALLPVGAVAAPSVGQIGSIDVSSVGTTPVDIVYDGTNAYFAEFSNSVVGQITDPLNPGSASASLLFTASATFGTGAGLTNIDFDGTNLLVSGSAEDNPGTAGDGYVAIIDTSGAVVVEQAANLNSGAGHKSGAAIYYGTTGQIIGSWNNGTHLTGFPSTLDSIAFIGDGGTGAFGRFITDAETYDTGAGQEVYFAGNTRFFNPEADLSEPAGTAGILNIRRYDPGSDTDDFATAVAVAGSGTMGNGNPQGWFELYSSDSIAANGYQGLGIYDDGNDVWIMLANTIGNEVIFVDRATGSQTGALAVTAPTDATMVDTGADRYLLVSQEGGSIAVFQEGATNVENWDLY